MSRCIDLQLTATHWGVYRADVCDDDLNALHPFERDFDPSPIWRDYLDAVNGPLRIKMPMVRRALPRQATLKGDARVDFRTDFFETIGALIPTDVAVRTAETTASTQFRTVTP